MNAPENTPAAYPINLAHEVLLKSDDAMCVDEVARAIIGKNPTKADIKRVAKLLKELADLGLIEMEPRAGGVPFYRLIVASESLPTKTYPPETLRAMIADLEAEKDGEPSFLAPEDYEMPPADPALLASANRMLCDRLEAKDAELLAQAKVVVDLRDQLEKKIQDHAKEVSAVCDLLDDIIFEPSSLADHAMEAVKEFKKVVAERVDLRDRLDALTQQWEADTGRITADLRAALKSRSQAINESDRLRAELATERQAREALQEQDGVDVKDAAVGYLIRVTKRKPRYVTKPERARDAALAAVRAGAGRAEVLAVVPVGVARRGAEWRGSAPQTKGD